MLVSSVRKIKGDNVTEADIIKWMPIVLNNIRKFYPWTKSNKCFNVRFEELITDPAIIEHISDYIGLPLAEDHFKNIWGRTRTATFNLSKWQEHWTPKIEQLWFDLGGHTLEDELGYDPYRKYVRRANG